MFASNVPKQFWGEAVLTATYLINRMPSRVLSFQTPCQVLQLEFPTTHLISDLKMRVFGCSSFVHLYDQSKLDPKSVKCIFLGYSATKRGYKCYSPQLRKVFISNDVTFHETSPFYSAVIQGEPMQECQPCNQTMDFDTYTQNQPNIESPDFTDRTPSENIASSSHIQEEPSSPGPGSIDAGNILHSSNIVPEITDLDVPIALRKPSRHCGPYRMEDYVYYGKLSNSYRAFITKIDQIQIPQSINEALTSPGWKEATCNEIRALEENGTWEMVKLPPGKKTVGCRWLFSVKYNPDGSVERFKARLVAKGYTQAYGVDYGETFAPVAKMNTVRILLSLAANLEWPLHQLDIKNAFLNGDLEEEVYMDVPPGFGSEANIDKVCKLKKSLYGLKQSPRAWFGKFSRVLTSHGFLQSHADHTMFTKHSGDGKCTILSVYVDDIMLTGSDNDEIQKLKTLLSSEFEVKDLGVLKYFLGMEVARSKTGISVTQRKYTLDLLRETGMLGCKPVDVPMDPNMKLGVRTSEAPADKGQYQRLVGKLIYLTHTRPDIGFAVSMVSRFMSNPSTTHMEAVMRILRYLKTAPGTGLFFKKNPSRDVTVFTDADWAGSISDRRSTSGMCTFVWGNLVTWRSKKQSVVARSSAEAELRSLAHGVCEGLWIKRLFEDLKLSSHDPIRMLCDNQASLTISRDPVHHDRTKHIEIDRHFIREKLEDHTISMQYVPSRSQIADILTKPLPRHIFHDLCRKLDLLNLYSQA